MPRARYAHPVGRVGVLALALLLLVPGCGAAAERVGTDCDIPASDVGSVLGWIGHMAEQSDDVALFVDDGRGNRVEHRADEIHPMASASKALNLVAYAHAVGLGRVDPGESVRVGDWERWSVLGSEQSHAKGLDALGIPRTGERAADPNRTVTIDQIANEMIIWSDNAAPDFLRARLGDQALLDAARAVGWNDPELPSTTGFLVSFFTPELLPPAEDRAARRRTEWELARRYANDPAFRADVDNRPAPAGIVEAEFNEGGPGGTARQLAALWSAVGRGAFPGAVRARTIAEQGPSTQPGAVGIGAKGGSMVGVLARGTEIRRADGSVGTAVLLVRRMSTDDSMRIHEDSQAFNAFLTASVQDPSVTETLKCRFPSP